MYTQSLCALAFVLLPLNSASAENVSCLAETTFAPGQAAPALTIPMPDPSRGTPDGMEIQVMVGVRGFVGVENVARPDGEAILFVDYCTDVSGYDNQINLAPGNQFVRTAYFGGFDGDLDFAGASGTRFTLRDMSQRRVQRIYGKALAHFLSTVNSKTMTLDVSGGVNCNVLGLDNPACKTNLLMSVKVCVTYRYAQDSPKQLLTDPVAVDSFLGLPGVARKPSTLLAPDQDDEK